MGATAEQASPWLEGRSLFILAGEFDRRGYLIFERVLSPVRSPTSVRRWRRIWRATSWAATISRARKPIGSTR